MQRLSNKGNQEREPRKGTKVPFKSLLYFVIILNNKNLIKYGMMVFLVIFVIIFDNKNIII